MYDGVNSLAAGIARDFPAAQMIAGYLTGPYAWTAAEWDLFPRAQHVTIVTTANANAGDVLDVERGDATPDQAHGWIAMRKANGLYRPTIYCSLSVVPAVRAATGGYILGRDYDIWVADWTGQPVITPAPGTPLAKFAAAQYANDQAKDTTIVGDDLWPRRTPPGPPPPPPVKPHLVLFAATAHYSDGTTKTVQL
jgi:hypothetical protein